MDISQAQVHNLVPTRVTPVKAGKLLWRDGRNTGLTDEEFVNRYCVVIPDSFFTDSDRFNGDSVSGMAERYGGQGLGTNGGGARVVNYDGVQLKGIGANALVGRDALSSHSYGGLDVQGAVKEIIYSRLINHISPVGAQVVYGLILLDRRSARYNAKETWSTILVREQCLRPAHLLSCTDFRVRDEFKPSISSDLHRIRSIYRNINDIMGPSSFVLLLEQFLENCADQLSFCRMARFSHNVLSASNLTMDGRFLDTSVCSFVHAGTNFSQVTAFYQEPLVPLQIVAEMLHLIEKYTFKKIPLDHFLQFYEKKFQRYAHVNLGFIFGVSRDVSHKAAYDGSWVILSNLIESYIVSGKREKTHRLPTIHNRDILNELLATSLFAAVHNVTPQNTNEHLDRFLCAMTNALDHLFTFYSELYNDKSQFIKVVAIQVLKRAYLSSFFFLTYISKMVDEAVDTGISSNVSKTIHSSELAMNWIYEDLGNQDCTLFESESVQINYLVDTDEFQVNEHDLVVFSSQDAQEFLKFVRKSDLSFKVLHYNFRPFLLNLGALFSNDVTTTFKGVKNVFERS